MIDTMDVESEIPSADNRGGSLGQRRILVVADCPILREFSARLFTYRGYEVRTAERAHEAFVAVDGWEPDAVLLDAVLPEMDAYMVCRSLRMRPGLALCPIMFLAGPDDRVDRVRAVASGASGFVSKNGRPSDLVDRVEACMRSHDRRSARA